MTSLETLEKRSYRDVQSPTQLKRERYDKIKEILGSGPKTIRRIFYMLGGAASYNTIIKDCVWLRLRNEIPWNSVLEEGRQLLGVRNYESLSDFMEIVPRFYRLNKEKAFDRHIEVWLEKATLERAFYSVTNKYDIGLLVTRGQVSWTALKDASDRLDEDSLILYFGDNDSYGRDIIYPSIKDFLSKLDCEPVFERIALTDEQETKFSFPKGEHHLDGMPERELVQLLEASIKQYLDEEAFNQLCEKEAQDAAKLENILESGDQEDEKP
ncbi:MAG: hypothetical protein ACLP5V_08325 [Candidatus Bathyarchaeia archaeon]